MTHRRFWLLVGVLLAALLLGSTVLAAVPAASQAAAQAAVAAKIEPLVLTELTETGQTDFFIWMKEKADLSPAKAMATQAEKGRFVLETLRATAEATQAEVKQALDAQGVAYRSFYVANKIFVRDGSEGLIYEMAARPDVAKITANHPFQLPEPFINPNPPKQAPLVIEPNITFVNADDVWGLGYHGEGIVLAGNDTGLDWDHPALINQYRGWDGSTVDHNYNWWDATGTYPTEPNDGHGHGTHTSGTMVGDDGADHQIGMAPGARLVHCKNMTDFGSGDDFTFTECFEWDLAPWDLTGANPDPDMAPDAINNSWGYWGGNVPTFEDEIAALQAAGIAVEVSAGNEGPGCTTLRSPGDYEQVITTGSVNHAGGVLPGTLTGFSSRGPSILYPSSYIPDIMAPGENINSSLPGGGYSGPTWSGTSMSGPHVTGLVALMWNASPALQGDIAQTYDAIYDTAVRLVGQPGSNCGGDYTTGPNNDWGYGTIDALAAVNEAILRGGPNFVLTVDPEEVSICTPDDAVFTADLAQILGYAYPVDMSLTGNPAGTTATFVPNPVTPPGTSELTIGNTGAAGPGTYAMTITGTGTDPETKTHSTDVVLNVFNTTPGGVALVLPADGASNVALAPTFTWNAANQAGTYDLEVATDPGFSNIVYTASVVGVSHTAASNLSPETTYYWHVRAVNSCGTGEFSSTFSFTTRAIPPILLVDDDNNVPDVLSYYTEALDNLGAAYDIWDTGGTDNEPTATDLEPYTTVIWFTGVLFGGTAGPGSAAEADLGNWLEAGNCFMISAQDYFYDRGLTSFMQTYLGVSSATSDVGQSTVTGAGSVFGGMGPYFLSYPFTNWSDIINPDGTAETAFDGNFGSAAVDKDGGNYRTTFWGFPFEAVADVNDRMDLMSTTLGWCGTGIAAGTLEGTVTDADTGLGIEEATVTADAGSGPRSTTTGADGSYSMNLAVGTYNVTAAATNYVSVTVSEVTIVTDTTTIQDFELQGSSLAYSPPLIEEDMVFGDKITNTVTLTASGPLPVDFTVRIGNYGGPGGLTAASPVRIPASNGDFPRGSAPASVGLAPQAGTPGEGLGSASLFTIPTGALAYGLEVDLSTFAYNLISFDTDDPATLNVIGNTFDFMPAGDFVGGDFSTLYGLYYYTNEFASFDTTTGAKTSIGYSYPDGSWSGMAGDPTTGDLYAASTSCGASSTLYTVDITSGALTTIGTITNSPCIIGIAVDAAGQMYGVDIINDELLSIDKNTGAGTVIGYIGYDANYSQGMDFDEATGILYMAAYNNSTGTGELRIIDPSTGNSTLVGLFGGTGSHEVNTMAVATGGTSASWVYAVPDEGTVPMDGTATFDVVFDARSLIQVGDYTAELTIEGTNVNPLPTMPLTMHLSCPTCGFLDGSIYDDTTGLPLAADIHVTGPGGFDVTLSGETYSLAVQPGSYDFTVSAAGYLSATATVVATQGVTTTTDFYLIPDVAILSYAPPAVEEYMEIGDVVTNTVTVTNSGAQELEYSVRIGGYGGPGGLSGLMESPIFTVGPEQQSQISSANLGLPSLPSATPLTAGDVIQSWSPGVGFVWGIAYDYDDSTVWVSSPGSGWGGSNTFYEFDADGSPTGRQHPYTWFPASGPADAAYNSNTGTLWIMDVAGDDCIHEIDPATGVTGNTICPGFSTSQRGLAYDPATDTFLAGSWNDLMIYRFDPAGNMLEQVYVGLSTAGLAYNPDTQHLFVMVNSSPNPVYVLDAANNYAIVGQFNVSQGFGDYAGAGLEMDCEGYLWAVDQATSTVYQFESDETTSMCGGAGDWAYAVPDSGTVPPYSSSTFDLVFDARSLYQVGDYTAELSFSGNFANEVDPMPLTMHISCPTCGFLDGAVYDANTMLPVTADIHVTGPGGFDLTLHDEAYALAVQPGQYDFTVTASDYVTATASVVATQGVTVTTDFALVQAAAILSYTPPTIEVTVGMGGMRTETLTVSNDGTLPFDFSLADVETGRPAVPPRLPSIVCPPDAFGYTCTDSNEPGTFAYDFEDISGTGTPITLSDDQVSSAIPMGLTFNYYGVDYTDVYVSSNGFLTFLPGQSNGCCTGQPIPTPGNPDAIVAAWWEDLYPPGGGSVTYQLMGDAPFRYFIVQFTDILHFGLTTPVTFQFKLFEGSNNIEVHYEVADSDGGTHSAGIENETGTIGLQYHYSAASLSTPLAVCYLYPGQFECGSGGADALWVTESPDSGTLDAGQSLDVDVIFDSTVVTQTGTYTAMLYFSGNFENDVDPATLIMHVEQPQYGLALGPDSQSGEGAAGTTVMYTLNLTNTGNVEDTFDVAISGNAWTTLVTPSSVTLGAGESAAIEAEVDIPADAERNESDTATIAYTSQSDPAATDEATVTTTVPWVATDVGLSGFGGAVQSTPLYGWLILAALALTVGLAAAKMRRHAR